ncbi:MAG: chromate transporter [Ascidiaceihabitans sp.]|jgi:chromate transporter|tara:strand:- start:9812 stop:11053 length:1242 start_codon:yes stop_codon:yes gene_type:complete
MSTQSTADMVRAFGRIGLLSFGGPAAQIAIMHEELVERRRWLSEDQFLRALSLCMLLPGPEAMQLATYAGWRLRGIWGGLLAGLLFVVPGALVIFILAFAYISYGQVPLVQAAFVGVKAAVIIVVLQALLRLGNKALANRSAWALAALAFVALFAFGLPFPLIIGISAIYGYLTSKAVVEVATPISVPIKQTLRTIAIWSALWAAPMISLWIIQAGFLIQLGMFFSKLAVVTFGGAYAVLAYMSQTVVQDYAWVTSGQMIDALGLAETTPGPLILVTEFVAILAGAASGGIGLAIAAGLLALWVTFIPCFLWIFAAGPYIETLTSRPRLSAALSAVTAAVVGVILNLSIWFALHVLFDQVGKLGVMPLPVLSTINLVAALLTGTAAVLMLRFKLGLVPTMGLMALAGMALSIV